MSYSEADVVRIAKTQVGYREKASAKGLDSFTANSSQKNNYTKYARDFDTKWTTFYNGPKQGFDYCEVLNDWCHVQASLANGGTVDEARAVLCQPIKSAGAGCTQSAGYYQSAGRWGNTPTVGAQIYFGDYDHTGIVIAYDSVYVFTIEGNTGNGMVEERTYKRNDPWIKGYGYPKYTAKEGTTAVKEFGIDISAWQGTFDIAKASKNDGVKFVIIRAGGADDGYYKDSQFESNYSKAKAAGLSVGAYFFSKALNTQMAKEEASYFYKNCLQGKQFDLPVYLDVENKTQLGIGKTALTAVIRTWCDAMKSYGYLPGIYSSLSYFNSYMNDSELSGYEHWVAQWSTSCQYSGCGMWQFGGSTNYIRSTQINGQTIDQDYMLKDYPTYIKSNGLNGYPSQQYTEGWQKDEHGWWYRYKDGSYPKSCWKQIKQDWYYFDSEGYAVADQWITYGNNAYYLGSDCKMVANRMLKIDGSGKLVPAGAFYNKLGDVTYKEFREVLDLLVKKGALKGESGTGDDMVINLSEEAVRMFVIQHRLGIF